MLSDDDRELLRLAAIACGELHGEWAGNDAYFNGVLSRWNPLTDDGDALRLAVALSINVNRWPDAVGRYMRAWRPGIEMFTGTEMIAAPVSVVEKFKAEGDPYAATRRAIVRAAAEIGSK